jgi:hypothetical protein
MLFEDHMDALRSDHQPVLVPDTDGLLHLNPDCPPDNEAFLQEGDYVNRVRIPATGIYSAHQLRALIEDA